MLLPEIVGENKGPRESLKDSSDLDFNEKHADMLAPVHFVNRFLSNDLRDGSCLPCEAIAMSIKRAMHLDPVPRGSVLPNKAFALFIKCAT